MINLPRSYRRPVIIAVHVALAAASYYLAYAIRFIDYASPKWLDGIIPLTEVNNFLHTLPYAVAFKLFALAYYHLYQGFWRYTSTNDLVRILKACTASTVALVVSVMLLRHTQGYPRSVFLLDWMFSVLSFGGIRFLVRLARETFDSPVADGPGRRTLIVGAGDCGEAALRELQKGMRAQYTVIGFLDDNPDKQGMLLHGVKVLGTIEEIAAVVRRETIEEVLFAVPAAPKQLIRQLVEQCQGCQVRFQIIPNMADFISGKIQAPRLREVELNDLLGRDPVHLEQSRVEADLRGMTVLVTGAGGSIGSELVRQVAAFQPARVIMVDIAESALFEIDRQLSELHPQLPRLAVLGDITDRPRMEALFASCRPNRVFHAAAYKHVPLMEAHPVEAVVNNVTGTRIVAEAARQFGVEKFVLISTDKAVHPRNVMGATKRCAELLLSTMTGGPTKFVAVRFGNVLGSNGSVVPVFHQQIATGGPVRVTHPDVTRYFMTIPEAVELLLQAAAQGRGDEVFMLEMGEPVSILALARNMIELSGLRVGEDIAIEFTGLRPGEKLHEELVVPGEDVSPTTVPKVLVHRHRHDTQQTATLALQLSELEAAAQRQERQGSLDRLFAICAATIGKNH